MATLYQLLLEQEAGVEGGAASFLAKLGGDPRLKRVLKIVGVVALATLLADVAAYAVAKSLISKHFGEIEAYTLTPVRISELMKSIALKATTIGAVAAAVAVILVSKAAFQESAILAEEEKGEKKEEKKLSAETIKEKAKGCVGRVKDALKKAAEVVGKKAEAVVNFVKEHKKASAAVLLVLVLIGVAILIYLRRERVDVHTAIESLRSAGLTARSPIVIGACILGVLAIAAAAYFIYKKKKAQ